MKKGLELPINMLVIIAIAVLILVVVALFFTGTFGSGIDTITFEPAFQQACNNWRTLYNCDVSRMGDVQAQFRGPGDADPTAYNVEAFCAVKLGLAKNIREGQSANVAPDMCSRARSCPVI